MSKIAVIGIAGESVFLSLDRFGKIGETNTVTAIHKELGGKGFNQAVTIARYGVDCSFLCAVNKTDAERFSEITASCGVKPCYAAKDGESPYAVITTDSTGANCVYVYRGAELDVSDMDRFADEIKTADLLLLNNETPAEVNERAAKIAKEHGVKIILNPAPARSYRKEFLQKIDLFTPNEHELEGLEGFDNVVVTLGSKGCRIVSTGEIIPAADIGPVVDTTGAGDTFSGVLSACIANEDSIKSASYTASIAAAIKVSRKYILDSIPTKEEINKFIKDAKNGQNVF